MTKYKFEANERKQQRIINSRNKCEVCDKYFPSSSLQLAHIVAKKKNYLKRFGSDIIHHDLNMKITCCDCNSSVMLNPDTIPGEEHINKIRKAIQGGN